MEKNTPNQLTLFAGDSLASPSQRPDSSEDQKMTVTSGQRCYELSVSPSQDGSLEKTFLGSSTWHSTMCHLTWNQKATKSGRLYYQLVPSMRAIGETESSSSPTETQLWSTPAASTGGGIPTDAAERGWKWEGTYWRRPDGTKYQTQLIDQARMWRTPMSTDWKNMDTANQLSLAKQVKDPSMWPTPTVKGNYNKRGLSTKSGDGLATAVKKASLWPTPLTRDYKGGRSAETLQAKGRLPSNSLPDSVTYAEGESGPLNPPFLEWLMGFPIGWTESKP